LVFKFDYSPEPLGDESADYRSDRLHEDVPFADGGFPPPNLWRHRKDARANRFLSAARAWEAIEVPADLVRPQRPCSLELASRHRDGAIERSADQSDDLAVTLIG
jgi:hypothetical protein